MHFIIIIITVIFTVITTSYATSEYNNVSVIYLLIMLMLF